MNKTELLNRIDELIVDKKSFLSNDQEANKIWLYDIETLENAKKFINERPEYVAVALIYNENTVLKETIERTKKYVKNLCSIGRGCEIYADIKKSILKQLEVTNENN